MSNASIPVIWPKVIGSVWLLSVMTVWYTIRQTLITRLDLLIRETISTRLDLLIRQTISTRLDLLTKLELHTFPVSTLVMFAIPPMFRTENVAVPSLPRVARVTSTNVTLSSVVPRGGILLFLKTRTHWPVIPSRRLLLAVPSLSR